MNYSQEQEKATYEYLKHQIQVNYLGYDLCQILTLYMLIAAKGKFKIGKFLLAKPFFTYDFRALEKVTTNQTLFTSQKVERKNVQEIIDFALKDINNLHYLTLDEIPIKFKFSPSNLLKALKITTTLKSVPIRTRLYLALNLAFFLNLIDVIEKQKIDVKKYCAFCSAHPLETLLTQFFNKRGVPTYSLQHALYYFPANSFLLDNLLPFENFPSNYLLCWGNYSKEEFIKSGISSDRLIVAGYPYKVPLNKTYPEFAGPRKCIVFLTRELYENANLTLLEILKHFSKENNIDIYIKLHPSLPIASYSTLIEKLQFNLIDGKYSVADIFEIERFDLSIAVNTTVYYESYISGIPCLRFNDGTFDDPIPVYSDDFSNYDELNLKYQGIPFSNIETYIMKAKERLSYILGVNNDEYKILN